MNLVQLNRDSVDVGETLTKGCSLSGPLTLKAKTSENFLCPKICQTLTVRGPADQGVRKVAILLQKAHPSVSPRRLSHFACMSVEGSDPQSRERKSQKVSDSHRNDLSPLTQGLRYRGACDRSRCEMSLEYGDVESRRFECQPASNSTPVEMLQKTIFIRMSCEFAVYRIPLLR